MASDLIVECDASVLAQWRETGIGYAADVVEAYQERLEAVAFVVKAIRSGRVLRPAPHTAEEAAAWQAADSIIDLVEEALNGDS